MPVSVFYLIYARVGLIPAIIVSLLVSMINLFYSLMKDKRIYRTQIFGSLGIVLSLVGVLFTDDEKFYYVPALISNLLFFAYAVGLTLRRRSIFHYVVKDFNLALAEKIDEDKLLTVNMVWLLFFLLKIVSKLLGILYLSFQELYWLVFILGDPLMILVAVYSVYYIRKAAQKSKGSLAH